MKDSGLIICLLGVLFGIFLAHAERVGAQGSEPTDKFALLLAASPAQAKCEPVEPMIAGSTSQGGYSFDYQSGRGKNCRVYRLCNSPGRELTPVRWRDKHETFFDVSLPRCPAGTTCTCIEVIKPSRQAYDGKTMLSYGVNKDEYNETPRAYSDPEYQAVARAYNLPFYVVVRGTVADAQGKPVRLGFGLASSVSYPARKLTYQMTAASGSSDFEIFRYPARPIDVLTLRWAGAESDAFLDYLKLKNTKMLLANDKRVLVDIPLPNRYAVKPEFLIVTAGDEAIFATTAPAYGPPRSVAPKAPAEP